MDVRHARFDRPPEKPRRFDIFAHGNHEILMPTDCPNRNRGFLEEEHPNGKRPCADDDLRDCVKLRRACECF
jgi:hypothetical protein